MANITPQMMLSFQDELEKQAISLTGLRAAAQRAGGLLGRQGTTAGAGAALGGAAGGALGGLGGAGAAYHEAKQRGETGAGLVQETLGGTWRGLKGGALLGAGVGGAAGLAGGARARALTGKLRGKDNLLGGISRFGERQIHALTGAVPHTAKGKIVEGGVPEALQSMRAGSWSARQKVQDLASRLRDTADPKARSKLVNQLENAKHWQQAASQSEQMGLTSLPGYLKAIVGKGKYLSGEQLGQRVNPLEALKTGVREQWRGTGTGAGGVAMKGLIYGMPMAGVASELATPSEPGEEGRFARAGKSLGTLAYGLAPIPLAGMGLLSSGLERAGGLVGKGVSAGAQRLKRVGEEQ